jgi:hypothetical protein
LEAGVDAEVGFEVGIFRNEEDDSLLVDESIPIEGPSFEILRYTGSDLNVSADFIGLTSTSPSITLTVENIAPGLPINPPTAKVLVERFEPLRWRATASDPRIIVTPDSAMGNGSMSGDSTQVTISIDPEDAASLSGEIALGVTFHNEDDLLGRDEEFLIVNVRELDPLLPLESVLGVWENNSDPDGIVGTFLTMTFESDGSWRYVFNSVREIEDVVQPPELIWDVSGTFRQEVDADIFCCIDNNRFLLAEWALWIESITDCIGSGTPEQREHFCGEVRSGLVFGSLLTTSRFYREATDRLGFLNEDNVFTRSAR